MKATAKQLDAYAIAKALIGTNEIAGAKHNPEIVKFFAEAGHSWVKDDETAWCAAFVNAVMKRAGMQGTGKLNARSFLDWGLPVDIKDAREGDVVIFSRGDPNGWQGHVGFLSSIGGSKISVLGGNQGNAVSIAAYPKDRLLGIRRIPSLEPAPATRRNFQVPLPLWLRRFLS